MIAAVYYNNSDIRIEEFPVPKIQKGELLVKVMVSGICGSDVMEWYRIKKSPRVLGHEISGIIEESKSPLYKKGQRVFVSHHVPCNNCKYCNEGNHTACETLHTGNFEPGGFAQYIRVPALNTETGTYILPDEITLDEGSMIEPLACVVRAQRVIDVKPFERILVLGCGISGLMNVIIAKLRGAYVIVTDMSDYRLGKAKEFGADEVINAKNDFETVADKVILCTGSEKALAQAYKFVDRKGIILFFTIPGPIINLPILRLWRDEVTLTSSYGAAPVDLEETIDLIAKKKVNVKNLITHHFPLTEIQNAYEVVQKVDKSLKVVLLPNP